MLDLYAVRSKACQTLAFANVLKTKKDQAVPLLLYIAQSGVLKCIDCKQILHCLESSFIWP